MVTLGIGTTPGGVPRAPAAGHGASPGPAVMLGAADTGAVGGAERKAMEFGAAIFFTDSWIGPAALGRALEERGSNRSGRPSARPSRFSPVALPQRRPPKKYCDVIDPFVTLAAAAAATVTPEGRDRGLLIVQRNPIQTAKQVATLDQTRGADFCSVSEPAGMPRRWPITRHGLQVPASRRSCGSGWKP